MGNANSSEQETIGRYMLWIRNKLTHEWKKLTFFYEEDALRAARNFRRSGAKVLYRPESAYVANNSSSRTSFALKLLALLLPFSASASIEDATKLWNLTHSLCFIERIYKDACLDADLSPVTCHLRARLYIHQLGFGAPQGCPAILEELFLAANR